jgi:hypothetical protein
VSDFQTLKLAIIEALGLGRDSLHLYVGFICLFVAVTLWHNKRSFWILLPGLMASFLLEAIDLHDDLGFYGYFRWSASFHDIVNTNVLPLLTFLVFRRYIPHTET